jgi:putative ABC transport system permease protein
VKLWLGAEWRRRRAATLGLILLTGLAGAVVLTVAAGARRTSTSLERLAVESSAADAIVDVGGADREAVEAIARLPVVAGSTSYSIVFAIVDGVEEDLALLVPHDDRLGVAVGRDRLIRGRRPNSSRSDEVVVNELAAGLAGVDVGDNVTIATLSPEQADAEDYFPPRGPALRLRVVGVTRGPDDLIEHGEAAFIASPALLDVIDGHAEMFTTYLGIRLVPTATVGMLEDAVQRQVPGGQELQSFSFDVRTKPARDAISALAAGLAIFGVVAAVASIVVVGQAVGRHVSSAAGDHDVLGALGMSRWAGFSGLVLLVAPIALGGAAMAVVGAVVASPVMPIGLARRAEPDPGFFVDGWVVSFGFAAVAGVVVGSAALGGWRLVRGRRPVRGPIAPPAATVAALRLGAGPVAATGVGLAFDRRPPSLPVRSALGGVTVALVGLTAVLIMSASLDQLVGSPERWGYPWDLMLNFTSADIDRAADEVAGDDTLAAVGRWDSGFSYVNGEGVRAFGLTPLRGDVGFSLRSGDQPSRVDEIVIGPATAERLAVTIGDRVGVAPGSAESPVTAHVVGIALFPEIDDGNLTDGVGYYRSAFAAHATVPDLFEAFQLVVRVAPGHDRADVVASMDGRFGESVSADSVPVPPGGVGNLLGVRALPRWLAAFVVVLGLGSLAHVLATTLGRRRHELATLRSLGLTPRQTVGCIVWQAVTIAAAGLVIGIPIGLIAGRAAWWAVADPIGVRTDASQPLIGVIALCFAALAAAALLAVPLGRQANHTASAAGLHTERVSAR